MAAPIWTISFAVWPSRSSRAIRDARKLEGTAKACDGAAATVRRVAPSFSAICLFFFFVLLCFVFLFLFAFF